MAEILAYVGMIFMVGLAGAGSAIATAMGGRASIGALKKKSESFGSYLVLSALPGTQGLYGFGSFFIFLPFLQKDMSLYQGAAIFGAGLTLGIGGFVSAIYQGKVCANVIKSIADGEDAFGKGMILAVFPELYAIIAFAATFLVSGILAN
jgi:V/A-type H+/Na+-transporting ATPase subunit K